MLLKKDVMTILTIASCGQAVLGLFGLYAGLKHNKLYMGIYMILLWVIGGLYMADGYIAYKEAHSYQFQMVQSGLWTKLGAQTAVIQKKVYIPLKYSFNAVDTTLMWIVHLLIAYVQGL
jgi:hypothetical protein